jgi:hypothetical protein
VLDDGFGVGIVGGDLPQRDGVAGDAEHAGGLGLLDEGGHARADSVGVPAEVVVDVPALRDGGVAEAGQVARAGEPGPQLVLVGPASQRCG